MKRGIYPGTFDPITNGHLDLVHRGLRIFEEIIVAVAPSPKKQPLFTIEERLHLIRESVKEYGNVRVEAFNGLLVGYAKAKDGVAIIRGLRAVSDFEYELQMALMNRRLSSRVETVFMLPAESYSFLSSKLVREIAGLGGSIHEFVPADVERRLRRKFEAK